jgi:uncharacterized cupredoxin-like copper-binding protein
VKFHRALGLVVLAALSSACVSQAQAEEQAVTVSINHSGFSPDRFEFGVGTTVRFVIHNRDPIDHEFILGDDSVQRKHELGTHARHGAVPGEVSVPAGGTRTTTYTFTEEGVLTIGCHLPAHFDYGMRANVVVTP